MSFVIILGDICRFCACRKMLFYFKEIDCSSKNLTTMPKYQGKYVDSSVRS